MLKANTETGDIVRHDFGNRVAGEATFIPRRANGGEDDGYLASFAFDPVNRTSDLVLLDAAHIEAEPIVVIRLPQRVPQGLHGTWIPKAWTFGYLHHSPVHLFAPERVDRILKRSHLKGLTPIVTPTMA
jgi:hypothetical protein